MIMAHLNQLTRRVHSFVYLTFFAAKLKKSIDSKLLKMGKLLIMSNFLKDGIPVV